MTDVGGDLRGLLRRAAVMWRLGALCKSGELPFSAVEMQIETAPVHLLSIASRKVELHVVRTDESDGFPAYAEFRQDRRASNDADLFEDGKLVPLREAIAAVPTLYGWLTWRADIKGVVTHLGLAMPEKDRNAWLAYVDVLKRVTARERLKQESAKPSTPNPALLLKFREDIARALEQNSNIEGGEEDGNG